MLSRVEAEDTKDYKKINTVLFNERKIKALKMFNPKTWCTKKPFDYGFAHHGYLLTSCLGQ